MKRAQEVSRDWKAGQKCEIYDHAKKQWVKCEVVQVFKDGDGEWVKVQYQHYGRKRTVEITSDDPDIRELQKNKQTDSVHGWKVGNHCERYNRVERRWVEGEVINVMSDETGSWLRVQCGQRIYDVFGEDVERDLKPRGASSMHIPIEDIQTFKSIAVKHRSIAPFLHRIFAKTKQFVSHETVKSYVAICVERFFQISHLDHCK